MSTSIRDRNILRELGRQVAEIAALPVQQETIALWKALNSLKPVRGMVMIDQISWHERCKPRMAFAVALKHSFGG
jgi:hypothetical protein